MFPWPLLFIRFVGAVPNISFPINSQVPPVAVPNEPFNFQFASSTFEGLSQEPVLYSLLGAPTWLQLDSSTRTFFGVPQTSDIGSATFQLDATSHSGSAQVQVTFVVSSAPKPQLVANISEALAKAGFLTDSQSVALHPNTPFDISFGSEAFDEFGEVLYYATLLDRAPLPSWMKLDSEQVELSGVTPIDDTYPQTFEVQLIASSIAGFSGLSEALQLVVSYHQLAFVPLKRDIHISTGQPLAIDDICKSLMLDGHQISPQNITSAQAQTPPWLSFDSQNLVLRGKPPLDTSSLQIRITVNDTFGDSATTYIQLNLRSDRGWGTEPRSTACPIATASWTCQTSSSSNVSMAETGANLPGVTRHSSRVMRTKIAVGLVVGIIGLCVIMLFGYYCFIRKRRRRNTRRANIQERRAHAPKTGISSALARKFSRHGKASRLNSHNDDQTDKVAERTFSPAPKLDVVIARSPIQRFSQESELDPHESTILRSQDRSNSDLMMNGLYERASAFANRPKRSIPHFSRRSLQNTRMYHGCIPVRPSVGLGCSIPSFTFASQCSDDHLSFPESSSDWITTGLSSSDHSCHHERSPMPVLSEETKLKSIRLVPSEGSSDIEGASSQGTSFHAKRQNFIRDRQKSPSFGWTLFPDSQDRRVLSKSGYDYGDEQQEVPEAAPNSKTAEYKPGEGFPRVVERQSRRDHERRQLSRETPSDQLESVSFGLKSEKARAGVSAEDGRWDSTGSKGTQKMKRSLRGASTPSRLSLPAHERPRSRQRSSMLDLRSQMRRPVSGEASSCGQPEGEDEFESTRGHGAFL